MNMDPVIAKYLAVGGAYLLGSVPFSFLMAQIKGVDIRTVGSGNVGATNVYRSVSRTLGLCAFAGDFLKGWAATLLPALLLSSPPELAGSPWPVLCAVAAIAGHNWPVFLKFRGGKGVATSAGALVGLAPAAMIGGFLTFFLVFSLCNYVSLASITAAIVVPGLGWWIYQPEGILLPVALTGIGLMVVWRHRSNIQRLLHGQESKTCIGRKKGPQNET